MRSKNGVKNHKHKLKLAEIKEGIDEIKAMKNAEIDAQKALVGRDRDKDMTVSSLLQMLKLYADSQRQLDRKIDVLTEKFNQLQSRIDDADLDEGTLQGVPQQAEEFTTTTKIPISEIDKRILQAIQRLDLACADDIKKAMGYKGRNAASARLKRLEKDKLIERHQLGRKVYYRLTPIAMATISPRDEVEIQT